MNNIFQKNRQLLQGVAATLTALGAYGYYRRHASKVEPEVKPDGDPMKFSTSMLNLGS